MGFEINFSTIEKSELDIGQLQTENGISFFSNDYLYEENIFPFRRLCGFRKMSKLYDALMETGAIFFKERVTWVLRRDLIEAIVAKTEELQAVDKFPILTDYDRFVEELITFYGHHDFDSEYLLFTAE